MKRSSMTLSNEANKALVVGALMLTMFLAAIEVTVVATGMPTIIGELGGFKYYSWLFSAFLLTQGTFIPVFGKLADIYGRRPVITSAIGIFLVGAFLCGQAVSMEQLIMFRAVQGLGAAGLQPITQTIIGDLYTLEERTKIQGWLSSVWGISSVLGPIIGGLIVDNWSWPWIFYINIPIGILAAGALWFFFKETPQPVYHEIDYAGLVLLVLGMPALLVFLIEGGSSWPWLSWESLSFLAMAAVALSLFAWHEAKAPEPLLPLDIFRNRTIAFSNLAVFFSGALTLGISSFMPTLVQGVMGTSATVAGLALGAMALGWPLSSTFSGRIMLRYGYLHTASVGSVFPIAAAVTLLLLPLSMHPLTAAAASFLMGAGMGLTNTTFIVAVQDAVSWEKRGAATGSNAFMRMLGSTVGVAVFGNIMNQALASRLAALPAKVRAALANAPGTDVARLLLDQPTRASLPPDVLDPLRNALAGSLHTVFIALLITALLGAVVVRGIPGSLPENRAKC